MRSIALLFTIIFLLGACTSNTIYKKPDDLIPKNQMVDLLTDMYLAKAAKNIKTKTLERNLEYMPLIFEKYGIDSLRFQHSNLYYMSRIDVYEAIHKKVEKNLKKIMDTIAVEDSDSLLLNKKKRTPKKSKE